MQAEAQAAQQQLILTQSNVMLAHAQAAQQASGGHWRVFLACLATSSLPHDEIYLVEDNSGSSCGRQRAAPARTHS